MFRAMTLARRLPAMQVVTPFVRALSAAKGGAVAKAPPAPKDLTTLIANEIRFEKEDASAHEKVDELRAKLAAKWTITDDAGSSRVTLVSADGRVAVDLDVTPISEPDYDEEEEEEGEEGEAEDEEDEEGEGDGYRMLVTIKGKEHSMRVGCMIKDYLKVHRVSVHPAGKLPSVNSTFVGEEDGSYSPNFDELDQKLQNGFYEHLAKCVRARGRPKKGAPPPPIPPRKPTLILTPPLPPSPARPQVWHRRRVLRRAGGLLRRKGAEGVRALAGVHRGGGRQVSPSRKRGLP
jgi:hypothetical protein